MMLEERTLVDRHTLAEYCKDRGALRDKIGPYHIMTPVSLLSCQHGADHVETSPELTLAA